MQKTMFKARMNIQRMILSGSMANSGLSAKRPSAVFGDCNSANLLSSKCKYSLQTNWIEWLYY